MEKLSIKKTRMKDLIRLMKDLERQVAQCSYCGMCQAVCPLYGVTGREADTARGKLALLDGLMHEMFQNPAGVDERLNRCLLCGSCAAECPSGVNVLEVFLNARIIISGYRGLSPVKKIIFRNLLANPQTFDRILEWSTGLQPLFLKTKKGQTGISCARLVSPLPSDRHIVPLAPVPFHKMNISASPAKQKGIKAAFFVGCLLDKVFPDVAAKIVEVLHEHGVTVIIPDSQGCCGIPALATGDKETFNRLVGHNIKRFNPATYDYLVTGCATCTAAIKKIWPAMADTGSDKDRALVRQIADKTYDISQFIVNITGLKKTSDQGDEALKTVVTYHDPCHLRKTLGVYAEPRMLIAAGSNHILKEMPDAEACCGMGGSFSLSNYAMSAAIGGKKVAGIAASGASVVATGCPACMIQLKDMLAKADCPVAVKHVIEIYAGAARDRPQ